MNKKIIDVNDLVKRKATEQDLCKDLNKYSDEVQEMAQNLCDALWRINAYESQMIYILNEALRPFQKM